MSHRRVLTTAIAALAFSIGAAPATTALATTVSPAKKCDGTKKKGSTKQPSSKKKNKPGVCGS